MNNSVSKTRAGEGAARRKIHLFIWLVILEVWKQRLFSEWEKTFIWLGEKSLQNYPGKWFILILLEYAMYC